MRYIAGMPMNGVLVKSPEVSDAAELLAVMKKIYDETPYLSGNSDEFVATDESEAEFLKRVENSERNCMICAWLNGKLVGSAMVSAVSVRHRLRHRATLGISVLKDAWGRGVGTRLMEAAIQAAQSAGFRQMELEVAEDNARAIRLYERFGFEECGRIPGGMRRDGEDFALVQMVKRLV